jgi:hypothetical protein
LTWLRRKIDEALTAPAVRVAEPPPPPYPQSPEQGADDLLDILLLIEGFAPSEPSREKITYAQLLL